MYRYILKKGFWGELIKDYNYHYFSTRLFLKQPRIFIIAHTTVNSTCEIQPFHVKTVPLPRIIEFQILNQ